VSGMVEIMELSCVELRRRQDEVIMNRASRVGAIILDETESYFSLDGNGNGAKPRLSAID